MPRRDRSRLNQKNTLGFRCPIPAMRVIIFAACNRIYRHSSCASKIFRKVPALTRDHPPEPLCGVIRGTVASSQSVVSPSPLRGGWGSGRPIHRPDSRQQSGPVLFRCFVCCRFQGKSPSSDNNDALFQSLHHIADLCRGLCHRRIRYR